MTAFMIVYFVSVIIVLSIISQVFNSKPSFDIDSSLFMNLFYVLLFCTFCPVINTIVVLIETFHFIKRKQFW